MTSEYLGVVVCRLQTPYLTPGHKHLFNAVEHRHRKFLVILGDRHSPASHVNPLSFDVRAAMVEDEYPHALIARVWDHPDNKTWTRQLDETIAAFSRGKPAKLYTGRDGFNSSYSGKYPVEVLEFGCDAISATIERTKCTDDTLWSNSAWRTGYIAAYQELFPRTFLTVDMLIYDDRNHILMGRRDWSEKYRFLGGFVEPGETFEAAARRETREESDIWVENFYPVKDFNIDDWRLRGNKKDTHKTMLMAGSVSWANPKAGDDMAHVEWVNPFKLIQYPHLIAKNHQEMFIYGAVPYLTSVGILPPESQLEAIQKLGNPCISLDTEKTIV